MEQDIVETLEQHAARYEELGYVKDAQVFRDAVAEILSLRRVIAAVNETYAYPPAGTES